MQEDEDLVLQLYGADADTLPGNILDVTIRTSRGDITGLLHQVEGGSSAVVWIGGASGDVNGPAGGLFADLSHEFVDFGISSFRIRYRHPGDYQECVMDTLAAIAFLKGLGAARIGVVGHSFGGAVAISAGALSQPVTAVVALSSQIAGTRLASDLAPRPLLLVHGLDDYVVPSSCSEEIYQRAGEPKELVVYPGTGHFLMESRGDLGDLMRNWLGTKMVDHPLAEPARHRKTGIMVHPLLVDRPGGLLVKEVALFSGSIADVEAEAIVCPTNDQLWMGEGVARSILMKAGEGLAYEAQHYAPAKLGSAIVVGGGRLKARYVFMAVTGTFAWYYRLLDEESVREATRNCLKRAEELKLRSIAFPALGAGIGGFAFEKIAHLMVTEVAEHLLKGGCLEKVVFALLSLGAFRAFEDELKETWR